MIRSSATMLSTASGLRNIDDSFIRALGTIALTEVSNNQKYLTEWLGRQGHGSAVCFPENREQLANVLRLCNKERVGVTVFGGNTGLVGGTLSRMGELIISLEKLNRILGIDELASTATVEAGVVLETLQNSLAAHKLVTPYDIGARGSCTVGGNIATHAGGINYIRHGPLRGNIIGLEVVLADGTILDAMSSCWKDNTGVDVKQLFIGSEGSLGIITKARLHCKPLYRHKAVALVHSPKPFSQSVLRSLKLAREHIGECLSAFEFFDYQGSQLIGNLPIPSHPGGFTILVEASGAASVDDRIESFIEALGDDSQNGVLATDIDGMKKLWHLREYLPVAMARLGPNLKYDVSLPQGVYYNLVELVRDRFGEIPGVIAIVGYGHVGDGNLHLNVAVTQDVYSSVGNEISDFVYSKVLEMNGSISAEHGIGLDKLGKLPLAKSKGVLSLSMDIKRLLDPYGILNPGRTIPFRQSDS